jgi:hypothetical protein
MSKPLNNIKNFADLLAEIIKGVASGTSMEIWFQDEARVGQKNGLVYQWAKRGTRPRQPKDQRYASCYIFGAVCPKRDVGAALVMPYADTEAMQKHLVEISKNVSPKAHAVLMMDGAGWHKSGDLDMPKNISPMIIPPYSPELNPVENIWQFLRQTYLSNQVFEDYDKIVDACCDAWNSLINEAGRITSIASRKWTENSQ